MNPVLLILNAGSSSVKFSVFGAQQSLPLLASGKVADIGGTPVFSVDGTAQKPVAGSTHEDALRSIIDWVRAHGQDWTIIAAGHRIVHGGGDFTKPALLDPSVIARLQALSPLAPLHQPHNLAAVEILCKLMPDLPQTGAFDTAFHTGHDKLFARLALPQHFDDQGIRRYGFHGLSYEWIAHVLRRDYLDFAKGRVIAAHLGNGASLCALRNGRSIDSTMGLTALDGLPMGTRCGSIDPGAVIYMIRDLGLPVNEVEHILYNESGLTGLSGIGNDVKTLLESKDPRAAFALEYFSLKIAQFMAMMAVSLGGVDGIVFTGGIGENAASIRAAILARLKFLGPLPVHIIPANEERIIAMQTLECLKQGKPHMGNRHDP